MGKGYLEVYVNAGGGWVNIEFKIYRRDIGVGESGRSGVRTTIRFKIKEKRLRLGDWEEV